MKSNKDCLIGLPFTVATASPAIAGAFRVKAAINKRVILEILIRSLSVLFEFEVIDLITL